MARAGSLRCISAGLLLAGAMLFAASCLNPRPDDMPSSTVNGGPGAQPSTPGSMAPTGNNPGIGGDNLTEEPANEGELPVDPGVVAPPDFNGDDSDDPDEASSPDAGPGSGIDPSGADAGPDGG